MQQCCAVDEGIMRTWLLDVLLGCVLVAPVAAEVVPDRDFGVAGVVQVDVPAAGALSGSSYVLRPSGGAVVALSQQGADPAVIVQALRDDGSADAAFGPGGQRVLRGLPGIDSRVRIYALAQDDASRLVLLIGAGQTCRSMIMRLLPDGRTDTTFNAGLPLDVPGPACYDSLRRHGEGWLAVRFIESYSTSGSPASFHISGEMDLARVTDTGTVDAAFGSQGHLSEVSVSDSTNDLYVLPDGRILVLYSGGPRVLQVEQSSWWRAYRADGRPDAGFGTNGRRDLPAHAAGAAKRVLPLQGRAWLAARGRLVAEVDENGAFVRALNVDYPNHTVERAFDYPGNRVLLFTTFYSGLTTPSQLEGTYLHLLDADLQPVRDFGRGGAFEAQFGMRAAQVDAAGRFVLGSGDVLLRYRYVRGVEPEQPIPALGLPALLLLGAGLLLLAHGRCRVR